MASRLISVAATVDLMTEECFECGVVFAMTQNYREVRFRDKQNFYCPSGHPQRYTGKTHEQELREARDRASALADTNAQLVRDVENLIKKNANLRKKVKDDTPDTKAKKPKKGAKASAS